MTKRRKLLCYGHYCYPKRIKHNRNKLITYHHKHYCKRCFEYLKRERSDRRQLYWYIKRKAMVTFPTGMMLRDIKNLRKRHYTYRGIHIALDYANKKSLKFNFHNPYFLRYVPFVYDKARRWQYNKDRQNDFHVDINSLNNKIKQVSVHSRVFNHHHKKYNYKFN